MKEWLRSTLGVLFLALVVGFILSPAIASGSKNVKSAEDASYIYDVNLTIETEEEVLRTLNFSAPEGTCLYDLIKDDETIVIDDGMIVSIDGLDNDYETSTYWMFYIADEMATVGVCQFDIMGDVDLTFKYEELGEIW